MFKSNGFFRVLPPIPAKLLEGQFRQAVIRYLQEEDALDQGLADKLLSWKHSGFSVNGQVRVGAGDDEGRRQLARHMIRSPFSLEKTEYKEDSGMIAYRSKMHVTLARNFQLLPGAKWLEMLLQHVPDKHLGLEVVAEGLETEEQLDFLREKGCRLFQGYHFSRPQPVEDFTKLLGNPKSGEPVSVPERYVPHFKPGKKLRERVDGKVLE